MLGVLYYCVVLPPSNHWRSRGKLVKDLLLLRSLCILYLSYCRSKYRLESIHTDTDKTTQCFNVLVDYLSNSDTLDIFLTFSLSWESKDARTASDCERNLKGKLRPRITYRLMETRIQI